MASPAVSSGVGRKTVLVIIVLSVVSAYSSFVTVGPREFWNAFLFSSSSTTRHQNARVANDPAEENGSIENNRKNDTHRIQHLNTSGMKIDSPSEEEKKSSPTNSPTIADAKSSDEEEDDDESSSSEEETIPVLSHVWHMPPHLSSEGQNPIVANGNMKWPLLNQSSIDLIENAAKYGLTPSEGCSSQTKNETESWCGKQGCWRTFPINSTQLESKTTCKTFWFAGFSMSTFSECKAGGYGGYRNDYAVALQSALYNAKDTLQPVLLVGKYMMEDAPIPKVVEWAAAHGAIVITVEELSFQHLVDTKLIKENHANAMGPFLRIDIPFIVYQHNLMDLPGICDRHVLYTDSDVAFVNKITQSDLDKLKHQIDPSNDAYALYGHQTKSSGRPINSGVMLFDVYRFQEDFLSFLEFGYEKGPFLSFDQGWLNDYFTSTAERLQNRTLLDNEWNWKSYWRLAPNQWNQVKIVHFHGPKIGKSLESMANCDMSDTVFQNYGKTYASLVKNGICCDQGMTANFMLKLYHELSPPRSIKC